MHKAAQLIAVNVEYLHMSNMQLCLLTRRASTKSAVVKCEVPYGILQVSQDIFYLQCSSIMSQIHRKPNTQSAEDSYVVTHNTRDLLCQNSTRAPHSVISMDIQLL